MKRFMQAFVFMNIVFSSLSSVYYESSDPLQRKAEHEFLEMAKKSVNITPSDINKRIFSLGSRGIEGVVALGLPVYGAYKTGQSLYDYAGQINMNNKIVWAGLAAVGTWRFVFPLLHDRLVISIVHKIDQFIACCEKSSIAKVPYAEIERLMYAINNNIYLQLKRAPKPEIAAYLMIDYFLIQGEYAIALLDKLATFGENAQNLKNKFNVIERYCNTLKHNRDLLAPLYEHEMALRKAEQSK